MKINVLSQHDYDLYTSILKLTAETLHSVMAQYLRDKYKMVYTTDKYIYAVGQMPVALLSHMDTVFSNPPENIFYDREQGVIIGDTGCGHDDRAGIFAIYKLLSKMPNDNLPTIILTQGEEIGGVGAEALVEKFVKPLTPLKYLIQLDRRGRKDCVFYDCDNPKFTKYIESFGFETAYGSFTDISFIAPEWGIAAVNLSIGYEDEHTIVERLYVKHFMETLLKVQKMLKCINEAEYFEYIEKVYPIYNKKIYGNYFDYYDYDFDFKDKCCSCKKDFPYYEMIYVEDEEKNEEFPYCPECVTKKVDWCQICGNPFLKEKLKLIDNDVLVCPKCLKIITEEEK